MHYSCVSMGCSSQQSGTFTETQRVRLCAQLALLAEQAPGFYLETLLFITVWQLLFMNKVTSRATMMAIVYCLVVWKREMLSPWQGGGVLPLSRLLISLLSLMVELRPRLSPCHAPPSLMQNTRDQRKPRSHPVRSMGKGKTGLGWGRKSLGEIRYWSMCPVTKVCGDSGGL